jgi:hypothetical protein
VAATGKKRDWETSASGTAPGTGDVKRLRHGSIDSSSRALSKHPSQIARPNLQPIAPRMRKEWLSSAACWKTEVLRVSDPVAPSAPQRHTDRHRYQYDHAPLPRPSRHSCMSHKMTLGHFVIKITLYKIWPLAASILASKLAAQVYNLEPAGVLICGRTVRNRRFMVSNSCANRHRHHRRLVAGRQGGAMPRVSAPVVPGPKSPPVPGLMSPPTHIPP